MDFQEAYTDCCSTVGMAARMGDVCRMQDLVWEGRPVDVMDNRGWRPIHEAAVHNHTGCLEFLLRQGKTDINWKTFMEETALMLAAREGHTDAVHALLLMKADPRLGTYEGFTALYEATNVGSLDIVKLLLKKGADPNFCNYLHQSPVHTAAESGHEDILKTLLNKGGNLNTVTDVGLSPVFLASQFGWSGCLKVLLEAAVDRGQESIVNTTAEDGASPLLIAAQEGHPMCIELLLSHGADPNITLTETKAGPVHYAIYKNRIQCLNLLLPATSPETIYNVHPVLNPYLTAINLENPLQCLHALLSAGVSVHKKITADIQDIDLHWLPWTCRQLMFEYLGYSKDCSLLCYKIREGPYCEEAIKLLLSHGLSPNAENKKEMPPLLAATLCGNSKLYHTLLLSGATPNIYHKKVRGNLAFLLAIVQEVTSRTEGISWKYICPLLLAEGEATSCFSAAGWTDLESFSICSVVEKPWKPHLFSSVRAFQLILFAMCFSVCNNFNQTSIEAFGDEEKKYLYKAKDSSWTLCHACRKSIVLHLCKQMQYTSETVQSLGLPQVVTDYLLFSEYSKTGINEGLETLNTLGSFWRRDNDEPG